MPRLDNLPIGPAGASAPADGETLMGQGRRACAGLAMRT
jgi:hypothetical protein